MNFKLLQKLKLKHMVRQGTVICAPPTTSITPVRLTQTIFDELSMNRINV